MGEHKHDDSSTSVRPADEIVAYLQTAGDMLPDTLRANAFGAGDGDPASLLVESAEGVTTFGGLNGHPKSDQALAWMDDRLQQIAAADAQRRAQPDTSAT
jgi:hypothetical protein